MEERIISPEPRVDDDEDFAIRPTRLDAFIGQDRYGRP